MPRRLHRACSALIPAAVVGVAAITALSACQSTAGKAASDPAEDLTTATAMAQRDIAAVTAIGPFRADTSAPNPNAPTVFPVVASITGSAPGAAQVIAEAKARGKSSWTAIGTTAPGADGSYSISWNPKAGKKGKAGKQTVRVRAISANGVQLSAADYPANITAAPSARAATAADVPHTYSPGCPVSPAGLTAITVRHWNLAGNLQQGWIVVNKSAAKAISATFKRALRDGFRFAMVVPIDHYSQAAGGPVATTDAEGMRANLTSGFFCRRVAGASALSQHAYGRGIDINPMQNPVRELGKWQPSAAFAKASKRKTSVKGVVTPGSSVYRTLVGVYGWRWGGRWTDRDLQHFDTRRG